MTRARPLHILAAAGFCVGAACFAAAAVGRAPWSVGAGLMTLSALASFASLRRIRRACANLALQLDADRPEARSALSRSPEAARGLCVADSAVQPVAAAVNQALASARGAVADAAMRVKELEIRLKFAVAERQHAHAILYSISDAVLVTDPFDEVVLANESAARTFELDASRSGRRPVGAVLRDPKMVQLIREMRQGREPLGQRVVEHQVQTPAGLRTFKITLSSVGAAPAPAGAGAIGSSDAPAGAMAPVGAAIPAPALAPGDGAGVVAVLHDMTRERELSDMKNDFVSMVSHELRTPLASIKAYIEMLIDGEAVDDKTTREFYDVIQNEANRLGRLIDNILNISRIESGLVRADKRPQSLTVIVKEALEVIAPQAAQKNIQLRDDLTPVFYQTQGDRDMLCQAVLNLLSNSVKYTPAGGSISVATTVDETARRVITRITDTGAGIPAKDLPYVFEKFYRSEANSGMANGTGLGLALCRHIIETVHQGRMLVESQVGKGSTFGFELDLCD